MKSKNLMSSCQIETGITYRMEQEIHTILYSMRAFKKEKNYNNNAL